MRRLLSRSGRFAALDRRGVRRTALVLGVGAALCAAAATLAVKEGRELHESAPPAMQSVPADPLVAEMRRCQLLGEPGAHDAGCLAAWAENRRRFLGLDRRPLAPNPAAAPTTTGEH